MENEYRYISGHEEQCKVIADKVVELGGEEIKKAAEEGRLNGLKPESIPEFLEFMHAYFAELQRFSKGCPVYCDVNYFMQEIIKTYYHFKENPDYYFDYQYPYPDAPYEEWPDLLKECHRHFAESVKDINLEFTEDLKGKVFNTDFVEEPIKYTFICPGNCDPFGFEIVDENGVHVQTSFFDEGGKIFDEPITEYFDEKRRRWVKDYPKEIAKPEQGEER